MVGHLQGPALLGIHCRSFTSGNREERGIENARIFFEKVSPASRKLAMRQSGKTWKELVKEKHTVFRFLDPLSKNDSIEARFSGYSVIRLFRFSSTSQKLDSSIASWGILNENPTMAKGSMIVGSASEPISLKLKV